MGWVPVDEVLEIGDPTMHPLTMNESNTHIVEGSYFKGP
jgi:hypothetical protein